tara:strand:+ start:1301 stop:1492 length:192 start_codon:yes stop_codon:yes gene_type:complete
MAVRFKTQELADRLEELKPDMELVTYQQIKKVLERGAKGLDPYTLSNLCRDLRCLPTDIVEYA